MGSNLESFESNAIRKKRSQHLKNLVDIINYKNLYYVQATHFVSCEQKKVEHSKKLFDTIRISYLISIVWPKKQTAIKFSQDSFPFYKVWAKKGQQLKKIVSFEFYVMRTKKENSYRRVSKLLNTWIILEPLP